MAEQGAGRGSAEAQPAMSDSWKRQSACVHVWDVFPVVSASPHLLQTEIQQILCLRVSALVASLAARNRSSIDERRVSEQSEVCFS